MQRFLEAGQFYSPDRHPSFDDLAYSSSGVVPAGTNLSDAMRRLLQAGLKRVPQSPWPGPKARVAQAGSLMPSATVLPETPRRLFKEAMPYGQ
jgi:hypothetical protein